MGNYPYICIPYHMVWYAGHMKKIEREDWFAKGLETIEIDGFQKITVDYLCDALNVTKGSFYHHFKNTDSYIEALMIYWVDRNTESVIAQVDKMRTHREKLEKLNMLVLARSHRCEQVIRGWSFSNEVVRKYVSQADRIRLEYATNLHILCGAQADAARQIAVLEYACLIGIQQLYPDMAQDKQLELYERISKGK